VTHYLSADEQEYGITLLLSCLVGVSLKLGFERAGLKPPSAWQERHSLFADEQMLVQCDNPDFNQGRISRQPWLRIYVDLVMTTGDKDEMTMKNDEY
jgi:hypothetical protein